MSILINNPKRCTVLDIWYPKYSKNAVMLAKYKIEHASPIIIINFTKAKHLMGQRFAIRRKDVIKCKVVDNGKIPVYEVPMDKLENYDTAKEIMEVVNEVFK